MNESKLELKLCHRAESAEHVSVFALSHAKCGARRASVHPNAFAAAMNNSGRTDTESFIHKRTTFGRRQKRDLLLELIGRPTYPCACAQKLLNRSAAATMRNPLTCRRTPSPGGGYAAGVSRLRSKKKSGRALVAFSLLLRSLARTLFASETRD